MYLNRRAPRGRDGRASDHLEPARWHMRVWSQWVATQRERGWPRESSEVRALQSKQATTDLRGDARWRGRGEPPAMPKETRPFGSSRIPNIDRARIGPHVDRLLQDLVDEGGEGLVSVLQAEYLTEPTEEAARRSQGDRAASLGLSLSKYKGRLREGLAWLSGRLTWVSLERRQAERRETQALTR